MTIGAEFAHPVPDSMSDDAAALCEPLSVGIAAIRKAELDGRSRVLIAGAGPIGIVVIQLARAYGATEIVASDPDPSRRDRAVSFGATSAVDPASGAPAISRSTRSSRHWTQTGSRVASSRW